MFQLKPVVNTNKWWELQPEQQQQQTSTPTPAQKSSYNTYAGLQGSDNSKETVSTKSTMPEPVIKFTLKVDSTRLGTKPKLSKLFDPPNLDILILKGPNQRLVLIIYKSTLQPIQGILFIKLINIAKSVIRANPVYFCVPWQGLLFLLSCV